MKIGFYTQRHCGIYRITHRPSGKCYIGQSVHISVRWTQHLTKNSSAIGKAIALSPSDFIFEIIELCDKKLLNEREVFYIQHFNSLSPNGYNKTLGGGCDHDSIKEVPPPIVKTKLRKKTATG